MIQQSLARDEEAYRLGHRVDHLLCVRDACKLHQCEIMEMYSICGVQVYVVYKYICGFSR